MIYSLEDLCCHISLTVSEVKSPENVPYYNKIPVSEGKGSALLEGLGVTPTFPGNVGKRSDIKSLARTLRNRKCGMRYILNNGVVHMLGCSEGKPIKQ
ncbi:hypothetical protein AVEN_250509-1 [Araneus ventricosus]|uniref:Uncharacterized protein n=1 Tax=Araneus ventricosus TaxID=182803 RepID=A0A4Y2FHM0_ARAVE|nr:hypothetical protein AVEN_250509-1 [Araneus ventricosus]